MSRRLTLGIDVGTTGTKAVLANLAGEILAQAGEEYPTAFRHPNWAEQDPEAWWRAACNVVGRVLQAAQVRGADVAAVAVSSQAPSVAPVDRTGQPVYPAMLWMDRRSEPQCDRWRTTIGDDAIAQINGGRLDSYYMAPKVAWFRAHEPAAYAHTHRFLLTNGFIVQRLCGAFTLDRSHAPLTLLYDSEKGEFSAYLLEAMGLDAALLPPISNCLDIVGEVTPDAAAATGLAAGTPVLAGMVDATAAGLEVGIVQAGDAAEMTGQSTVLMVGSDRPYHGTELIPLGHVMPGLHMVVGATVASGGALRWFRDQLGESEREAAVRVGCDPFDLLTAAAEKSPPGANRLLFLPYLYGERSPIWDRNARGVFFGLSLATQKGDLVRAVLEGAAFGLRHNVEVATRAGFPMPTVACVGGGSRSRLWNQIKADILQRPIRVPPAAAGAPMGDAIAAAVGVGLYPSVQAAVANMVSSGEVFAPRPELAGRYDALFAIYLKLYPALREEFAALAEVPGE